MNNPKIHFSMHGNYTYCGQAILPNKAVPQAEGKLAMVGCKNCIRIARRVHNGRHSEVS